MRPCPVMGWRAVGRGACDSVLNSSAAYLATYCSSIGLSTKERRAIQLCTACVWRNERRNIRLTGLYLRQSARGKPSAVRPRRGQGTTSPAHAAPLRCLLSISIQRSDDSVAPCRPEGGEGRARGRRPAPGAEACDVEDRLVVAAQLAALRRDEELAVVFEDAEEEVEEDPPHRRPICMHAAPCNVSNVSGLACDCGAWEGKSLAGAPRGIQRASPAPKQTTAGASEFGAD